MECLEYYSIAENKQTANHQIYVVCMNNQGLMLIGEVTFPTSEKCFLAFSFAD
jgi:hypothetical protein